MKSEIHDLSSTQSNIWAAFIRAVPTGITILPIGMLLGVLAAQANWSAVDVLLLSAFGFSGSGQFALLPLADKGIGFMTMLLMALSINSRYIPIAFATASRLPNASGSRAFIAHLLGDEAYALEHERDAKTSILTIRLTIYVFWVLSCVIGVFFASLIPRSLLDTGNNFGFPASVVLLALSFGQIKARVPQIEASWRRRILEVGLCVAIALLLFMLLGKVWFWLPSIAFSIWRMRRANT
jgi:predicted branched-subunit amino acid permease